MRPTQCVSGLYLTVGGSLAPLPINDNYTYEAPRGNTTGLEVYAV